MGWYEYRVARQHKRSCLFCALGTNETLTLRKGKRLGLAAQVVQISDLPLKLTLAAVARMANQSCRAVPRNTRGCAKRVVTHGNDSAGLDQPQQQTENFFPCLSFTSIVLPIGER